MSAADPLGYYRILGVAPNASAADVKAAFRRKAQEYHPDRCKLANATVLFQQVNHAFSVLGDPESRARYDTSSVETTDSIRPGAARQVAPDPIRCSVCNKVSAQPRYVIFYRVFSVIVMTRREAVQGVQALQHMAINAYDAAPSVDHYLDKKAEQTTLPDGLRICAARIARAMYTLRNKRNVAHKNEVDPNTYDLAFAHQSAAWILAELLRSASGITMEEAGALIALVQAPVGTLVEEIGGTRLVHADVSVRDELLLLLHSHYPDPLSLKDALTSLRRRDESGVRRGLRELDAKKLAHGDTKAGYLLSAPGHQTAVALIQKLGS